MAVALEVNGLVKKFGSVTAVDGISFSVESGTCFGLIGPNGAGKTTTIEVIEDIIGPTSGEILYNGKPRTASFREKVGIQFQETSLLAYMTVRETLETFKNLYSDTFDLDELSELCHLKDFQKQMNDKISGGQKQRFLLALALINKPELLFLDEPSTGLDPQSRRNLWDIVQKIKSQGKTIILTTHYMEEAQYLCDEVSIMDYGKIIAQGQPDELVQKYCGGITVILPRKNIEVPLDGFSLEYRKTQDNIEFLTDNVNSCLDTLLSQNINLAGLTVRSQNLESVFLNLTGRQLRE